MTSALAIRLALPGFALAACQLVAPLADVSEGGERGGSTTSASSSASSATGPWAVCPNPACDAYCSAITTACDDTPQFPSVGACCVVCATYPAESDDPARLACRPVPRRHSAEQCTAAGPLGAIEAAPNDDGACPGASQCHAFCALFAALCGPEPSIDRPACELRCLSEKWPATNPFSACAKNKKNESLGCRIQTLVHEVEWPKAGHSKSSACDRALDGECPEHACE